MGNKTVGERLRMGLVTKPVNRAEKKKENTQKLITLFNQSTKSVTKPGSRETLWNRIRYTKIRKRDPTPKVINFREESSSTEYRN